MRFAAHTPSLTASGPATPPEAPPLYPTQLPPKFKLAYALRYDLYEGEAVLDWHFEQSRYQLTLRHELPRVGASWQSSSEGQIGLVGLIPEQTTEQWPDGAQASTRFLTVDKPPSPPAAQDAASAAPRQTIAAGAQDRLSWIIQLSAIAHSRPSLLAPQGEISLLVGSAWGPPETWRFRSLPPTLADDGMPHLMHEATGPQARRVEVWLNPKHHHLPARILLTEPGLGSFDMMLPPPPTASRSPPGR